MKRKLLGDFQICISVPLIYLHFCLDYFVYVGKWLDKKANVNFKIHDVTNRTQTVDQKFRTKLKYLKNEKSF